MTSNQNSFFERNSKKILFGIVFISFLALLSIFELILQNDIDGHLDQIGEDRYIRLRENPPGQSVRYWSDELNKEVRLDTDNNGYIKPAKVHTKPNLTIAFLGGSTTESYAVDPDKRFPYLASRLLEKSLNLKINSLNVGMSASNSMHSLNAFINKVLPDKPDIAVIMHNINDLIILLQAGSYRAEYINKTSLVNASKDPFSKLVNIFDKDKGRLFRNFLRSIKQLTIPHSWKFIRDIISKLSSTSSGGTDKRAYDYNAEKMLSLFDANIKLFIDISRSRGVLPILMTQFHRWGGAVIQKNPTPLEDKEFQILYARFMDRIREIARRENVPLIDLERLLPLNAEMIGSDMIHLTDIGSVQVAKIVAKKIMPIIQVKGFVRN